jgi:hypothetical protein
MNNVTEHKTVTGTHHTDVTEQKIRKSTKKKKKTTTAFTMVSAKGLDFEI